MNLAERIEAATGPDRELDAAIDALLGWSPVPNPTMAGGLIDMMHGPGGVTVRRNTPAYTGSIDAAMLLLPEGWCIASLEWWPMTSTKSGVTLREVRENEWGVGFDQTCGDVRSHAATPALALAAAAIRAGAK